MLKRIYTIYQKIKPTFIPISLEQVRRTEGILDNQYAEEIISNRGILYYLINGSGVLRTKNTSDSPPKEGWYFQLHSETKKGLERIAKKLRLPLE